MVKETRKRLKPSKKLKKRYLAFEIIRGDDISAVYSTISSAKAGLSPEANIRLLKDLYNPSLHRGIIKVSNKYARSLADSINKGKDLKTLGMSGILRVA